MRGLAVLALLGLTAAAAFAAAKPYVVPNYTVVVTLSGKAAAKLASSHEQVHVWAHYFGEAKKASDGDEMGEVQFSSEEQDIAGAGTITFGGTRIAARDLAKIKAKVPDLLVNVYTSRKVFPDNLFNCDLFQDLVTVAAAKPITLHCKLIEEP